MTNDITRYEVNQHGEIPLSYGRYVRWEDYEDVVRELLERIEKLDAEVLDSRNYYSEGFEDGWEAAKEEERWK
jgi:hypothetical protein